MKSVYNTNDAKTATDTEAFLKDIDKTATLVGENAQNLIDVQQILEDLLPVNEATESVPGQINWLGSSYSGTDIKVIAHLYESIEDTYSEESLLKIELLFAQQVSDACTELLSGGFAQFFIETSANDLWENKRKAFIDACGLSNEPTAERAINFMIGTILAEADYNTIEGISKSLGKLQGLETSYGQLTENLRNDIIALEELKKSSSSTVTLGTLQTLSLQSHREKFEVRALGHSYAKGVTRGQRTIAGSMIFTVFEEHPLAILQRAMASTKNPEYGSLLPDQLPPIDITIVFANEYGSVSELRIYGVEFINDGVTFSIEDLLSENVMQFICRDADVMTARGNISLMRSQRYAFTFENNDTSGSDLLHDNSYQEYLDKLGVRRKLVNR